MLNRRYSNGLVAGCAFLLATVCTSLGCEDASPDLSQEAGAVVPGSPGGGSDAGTPAAQPGGPVAGGTPGGGTPSGGTPGTQMIDGSVSDASIVDSGVGIGAESGIAPDAMTMNGDGGSSAGACTNLLPLPENLKQRGPWDVGVRTVKIGRLTVEITYPAAPGSGAGKPEATYDIRDWLPPEERNKVPADHSPAVTAIGGHFYRDLPIDAAHGPYPVVIFIHGTASFRIASGSTSAHWSSRGFVVLSAD